MEKKMFDKEKLTTGGKKVARALNKAKNKAVGIIDQNDDGNFNKKDVGIIADAAKKKRDEKEREKELSALKPIFPTNLLEDSFNISKLIQIAEIDKRRAESEACANSVGYWTESKGVSIVNVFADKAQQFDLNFYPKLDKGFYYVDPVDASTYIELDSYFSYLKIARISELQKIAQDLGATHFKITYKEEKSSFTKKNVKANVKGLPKLGANADTGVDLSNSEMTNIEIAAEGSFPGHDPKKPKLKYMAEDLSVRNLIAMRMDKNGAITNHKFTLRMSDTIGIKESEAVKIDAAFKALKVEGNTTITNEVQNEARRYLEYEIEF